MPLVEEKERGKVAGLVGAIMVLMVAFEEVVFVVVAAGRIARVRALTLGEVALGVMLSDMLFAFPVGSMVSTFASTSG